VSGLPLLFPFQPLIKVYRVVVNRVIIKRPRANPVLRRLARTYNQPPLFNREGMLTVQLWKESREVRRVVLLTVLPLTFEIAASERL